MNSLGYGLFLLKNSLRTPASACPEGSWRQSCLVMPKIK